tara:strand:+ start:19664 stop:20572 length:909 start_codon:yes stop_codon:yes gene_type:complete
MNTHQSFFGGMPPELRVIAYSNLFHAGNFKGDTKDLVGILSSCKLIKQELEHELTKAFQETLDATLARVHAEWNDACDVSLRVTQTGSRLDEMALTVSMPQSGLLDKNEWLRPKFRWNTDNGLGHVYEILHPLLSFSFKTLTFNIYQDDGLFPRRFNDEPNMVPLFQDIVSLLCRGHLMNFENSATGRNKLKFDGVLAKEIVFDWSVLNVNYYDEADQNASLIAEATDPKQWDVKFAQIDGTWQDAKFYRWEHTQGMFTTHPIRAVWTRHNSGTRRKSSPVAEPIKKKVVDWWACSDAETVL